MSYPAPGERPENHQYSNLFPMLDPADLAALAKDIKANGQREPIVLLDGLVLDGRNRRDACLVAGVEPFYRFYDTRKDGKSPLAYVISENVRRRHLTKSQAAIVAAESLPLFEAEAKAKQTAAGKAHTVNLKSTPAAPPAESVPSLPAGAPDACKRSPAEITTLVMQARAMIPVLRETLKTGKHPNGKAVKDEEEGEIESRIADCDEMLKLYPEEVLAQEERLKRIDETPAELSPAAQNALDIMQKRGKLSAAILQTELHIGYAKASEILIELEKAGKITMGAATNSGTTPVQPVDELDQRTPESEQEGTAPAPEPKKPRGKRAPTAAAAAGANVGVGEKHVRDAAELKAKAPELAEQVKAGKLSVGAAKKKAAMEGEAVTLAIGRIRSVCGASLADAVQEGTRLKKPADIVEYAGLPDDEMIRLRTLIDQDWDLSRAKAYKAGSLSRTHRLHDLCDRAAANGGTFTLDLEGWRIDVSRMPAK